MEKTQNSDPVPPPVANPMAGTSLVLGLASVILFVLFLGAGPFPRYEFSRFDIPDVFALPLFWLISIPAIILGHLALRKIGRIFGPVKGGNVARVGLILGYFITVVMPVMASLTPRSGIMNKGKIMKAVSNCRQILTMLRLYSSDNSGCYPDTDPSKPTNSNDAFRLMFVGGQTDNEMIFGCPLSPYQPDGKIGNPPDFREALKPGENHWAMTTGLSDSVSGAYPLVFENSAEATWPPKWNTNFVDVPKPGRVWSGSKIIIGMNDCSVTLQALQPDPTGPSGLKYPLDPGDKADVFTRNDPAPQGRKIGILNVAR